jgi:diguanylate cyclase (GGDEF)-like protein/PAS domain S-box-containing protein
VPIEERRWVMKARSPRRGLGRLFKQPAQVVLTGVAFAVLHRLGLLGDVPLWALLGLLIVSGVFSTAIDRAWGGATSSSDMHKRIACQMMGTAAVIYATGWGPMLAIGYVVIVADELKAVGSRAARPSLLWSAAVIGAGQLAIALHMAPSVVDEPLVHGLGVLSALGLVFVIQLLEAKTVEVERAHADLLQNEERFRSLVQNASDVVGVVGADGTLTYMSPASERLMGWTPEKIVGNTGFNPVHAEDRARTRQSFFEAKAHPGGSRTCELRARHADGEWRSLEVTWTNLYDEPSVRGMVANLRDITERKDAEASLAHQALHDPLTDLPNRALFLDRLTHALDRAGRTSSRVAVLYVDLDRFKLVNDSFGHAAGDSVLLAVADLMSASIRPGDTLARLGGDEFVVCCEDLRSPQEAIAVAERIQRQLRAPFTVSGQEAYVTASIGIVVAGEDMAATAETMLRDSDAALYRAKDSGRDRFELFGEDMRQRALTRLKLESEFRRVLERGELDVFYQPEIALETGIVTGVEALARWRHPEQGFIPPGEFVPLAEESGLIAELDEWVLRTACREVSRWDVGPVRVAVNVSGRHLEDQRLAQTVAAVLAETGLHPELLCLEITESVFVSDAPVVRRQLRSLEELGVALAVDDFGTGYSSLRYLKRFPIHSLKIDRTFVAELERGPRDVAIVQAVITLAHALDLSVVAEGVETPEQLAVLKALGCEVGQGYYWSEAVSADDLRDFVRGRLITSEAG